MEIAVAAGDVRLARMAVDENAAVVSGYPSPHSRWAARVDDLTVGNVRRIVDAMAKAMDERSDKTSDRDASLKRLGGGRWQTRDERFTIEPQSGTWAVVDAEQADELGLPLVRGPFGSLGAAKEAIAAAREEEPAPSALAARSREGPAATSGADDVRPRKTAASASKSGATEAASRSRRAEPADAARPAKPEPPAEPRWMKALEPADRRRAKRLMDRLGEAGAPDPEGLARRDIAGEVPAAAAFAIAREIKALGDDAAPATVARLLVRGRDDGLGVRWRLVDGEDRPITLDLEA